MADPIPTVPCAILLGAACARVPDAPPGPPSSRCDDAALDARGRALALGSRAFDLRVGARGYVVALAAGVAELHPCTFERAGGCDDPGEARRLAPGRSSREVIYLRADGSVAACDLDRGLRLPPPPEARALLSAADVERSATAEAWIARGHAWLRPRGLPVRALEVAEGALDVAIDPSGAAAVVADRDGSLVFFTVPGGLAFEHSVAHPRNAYAVAFDPWRRRVVSIAGVGRLAWRAWPIIPGAPRASTP